jgi:hypothetical protein
MENIVFSLQEKTNNNLLCSEDLNTLYLEEGTNIEELETYYRENYNARSLQQILQYYGIPKKNMNKDEMLQRLLFFESEQANREIVLKRMRLWQNISELKADAFFAKFINFNV